MILASLTLLLAAPPPAAPALQDPAPAPAENPPEPFPALRGRDKESAEKALLTLRRGKTPKQRQEAARTLAAIGRGAVPLILKGAFRFDEERMPELLAALDGCLAEADLGLAWKEHEGLGKKRVPALRRHLVRRIADSGCKDAVQRLLLLLEDEDPGVAWEAARGLAWRGRREALPVLHRGILERWSREHERIRADFAGLPRGPLSAAASSLLSRGSRDEQVAAVHLFELLGVAEHAGLLRRALQNSDYNLRLAAINACRVVVDGDPPLERPSVFEQVEMARTWEERLRK